MGTIQWWRSWHGAPTDHKWQVVAAKAGVKVGIVSAVVWALMDYASQHKDRGSIAGFDAETYAVYSGFDEAEVLAIMRAMADKGITKDGRFVKWEERQPKREDDYSTERVRRWREMKRNETQGNAPELREEIKDTDTDTELRDDDGADFQANALSVAFEKASGIVAHDPVRWTRTLDDLQKIGVEPCDIEQAVQQLRDKHYSVVGIWSVKNPAIACMSDRKAGSSRRNGRPPIKGV